MAKQKHQIVYFKTTRSSRYGLASGFLVYNRSQIIKFITKDQGYGTLRYGIADGKTESALLSQMSLELFEQEFPDAEKIFTPKQVSRHFSKAVSEKYGEHKLRKAMITLKPADIKPFHIYEDSYGHKQVYLGTGKYTAFNGKFTSDNKVVEGHVFMSLSTLTTTANRDMSWVMSRQSSVLKAKRKFVKEVGKFTYKKLASQYKYERDVNDWYGRGVSHTESWELILHDVDKQYAC